jgi:hypothetical protein
MSRSPGRPEKPFWERFGVGVTVVSGLIGMVAVAIGTFWAISTYAIEPLRQDVASIRESSAKTALAVEQTDKQGIIRLSESTSKLSDQIGALNVKLASYQSAMDYDTKILSSLQSEIEEMRKAVQAQQFAFNDPKNVAALADALKKEGVEGKVIIVPLTGAAPR